MKHVVLYIPGIGDSLTTARRLLTLCWYAYGVKPVVHEMNWSDKQPFDIKLKSLLARIDGLVASGHVVSLVGESAGASAAIDAYALRQDVIHRVACICGKLKNPQTIRPQVFQANPAFAESMAALPGSLSGLSRGRLRRIRSIRPLNDASVPVADTIIPGAESFTIPVNGHGPGIVFGDTVFSYKLVPFLKRP
jgi:hypothetical protein